MTPEHAARINEYMPHTTTSGVDLDLYIRWRRYRYAKLRLTQAPARMIRQALAEEIPTNDDSSQHIEELQLPSIVG